MAASIEREDMAALEQSLLNHDVCGVSLNDRKDTPLRLAARLGKLRVVERLVLLLCFAPGLSAAEVQRRELASAQCPSEAWTLGGPGRARSGKEHQRPPCRRGV